MGGGELDPDCLACLRRLTDAVPLRIVVTSTWRLRPEKMAQLNAAFEVSRPPPSPSRGLCRPVQPVRPVPYFKFTSNLLQVYFKLISSLLQTLVRRCVGYLFIQSLDRFQPVFVVPDPGCG